MAKPVRPLVSSTCDLTRVLTADERSFVGFSSSTGMVNTRHYILGWSFGMNAPAPPIDVAKLPRLPRNGGPRMDSRVVLEIALPVATAFFLVTVSIAAFLFVRRHVRYAEVLEDWEAEFGPHTSCYDPPKCTC